MPDLLIVYHIFYISSLLNIIQKYDRLGICYQPLTAEVLRYNKEWDMVPVENFIFHSSYSMIYWHSSHRVVGSMTPPMNPSGIFWLLLPMEHSRSDVTSESRSHKGLSFCLALSIRTLPSLDASYHVTRKPNLLHMESGETISERSTWRGTQALHGGTESTTRHRMTRLYISFSTLVPLTFGEE